jgi:hypothetical protein
MNWGKARIEVLLEALQLAEADKDRSTIVDCYSALSYSYRFCGEVTKMVAPFLWLDKFRQEHPEEFSYNHEWTFASDYKSFVGVLRDLPTASVEQNLQAMAEMEKIYLNAHFGLKPVHLRYYFMYKSLGRKHDAHGHAQIWLDWKNGGGRSGMDDCAGCDPEHMVGIYQYIGDHERAVATVERVLAQPRYFCSNQPEGIKSLSLWSWLAVGDDDRAWAMHRSVLPKHLSSSLQLCRIPEHLRYLGGSALQGNPDRWDSAVGLLCKVLPWWVETETPRDLMEIATQSAFVLHFHPEQDRVLSVRLPGKDLPWYPTVTIDQPTIGQAGQWCAQVALGIAEQFDKREGLPVPFEVHQKTTQIFELPDIITDESGS